ncbi:TonB-dependent receptor plug domain-containing protein [Niveispirillum sp. KHB5.9]|uniref:TonB-dependent receptor plug domain-containing protein n=1 Tax=Niveispirillum sp. KHB5.9 TaxID=3400269 RepID=UPI003A88A58E
MAKGYASVLDGPGALGGAVNLVTIRPTKEAEAEARGTISFDNDGDYQGYTGFARLGTKQESWYAQARYSRSFTDHWDLPDDFTPTATEDGGERDFSRSRDDRLNLKLGWTPNATDEYAINYTRQEGSKNAPLHVSDALSTQRFWSWPQWDIDSMYFLSTTSLGDKVTLKTRAYRTGFDNLLRALDNRNQNSQTLGRAFNSYYDDEAWGGSARVEADLGPLAQLGVAAHYRRDRHVEWQQSFPAGSTEPKQTNLEDTYSLALENRMAVAPAITFTLGGSVDWRDLRRAEEYGAVPGRTGSVLFSYPIKDSRAWNVQGRVDWTVAQDTELHASLSSRTRFPTIFGRFSSRFGGAVSNPDLDAERATQVEVGGVKRLGDVTLEGAVFHAWLDDAIIAFPFIYRTCIAAVVCTDNAVSQSRNVGKSEQTGLELSVTAVLSDAVWAGANYTYLARDLDDPSIPAFHPTGVPRHKGFAYVDWTVTEGVSLVPNVELASSRWTVNTAGTRYYRTGAYALVGLRAEYRVTDALELSAGGRTCSTANIRWPMGSPNRDGGCSSACRVNIDAERAGEFPGPFHEHSFYQPINRPTVRRAPPGRARCFRTGRGNCPRRSRHRPCAG